MPSPLWGRVAEAPLGPLQIGPHQAFPPPAAKNGSQQKKAGLRVARPSDLAFGRNAVLCVFGLLQRGAAIAAAAAEVVAQTDFDFVRSQIFKADRWVDVELTVALINTSGPSIA